VDLQEHISVVDRYIRPSAEIMGDIGQARSQFNFAVGLWALTDVYSDDEAVALIQEVARSVG
jgi:hypothetical protein